MSLYKKTQIISLKKDFNKKKYFMYPLPPLRGHATLTEDEIYLIHNFVHFFHHKKI